jgi:hypothetical protein
MMTDPFTAHDAPPEVAPTTTTLAPADITAIANQVWARASSLSFAGIVAGAFICFGSGAFIGAAYVATAGPQGGINFWISEPSGTLMDPLAVRAHMHVTPKPGPTEAITLFLRPGGPVKAARP